MSAANRLISWLAVPNGSTLKIKVTGSDSNFDATGLEITQPGGVKPILHSALTQGTSQQLVSPIEYSVVLTIAFLGANPTTVTVEASVTKPDGKPYGAPRPPHVCTGKTGETDTALVQALTRQNPGANSP